VLAVYDGDSTVWFPPSMESGSRAELEKVSDYLNISHKVLVGMDNVLFLAVKLV